MFGSLKVNSLNPTTEGLIKEIRFKGRNAILGVYFDFRSLSINFNIFRL